MSATALGSAFVSEAGATATAPGGGVKAKAEAVRVGFARTWVNVSVEVVCGWPWLSSVLWMRRSRWSSWPIWKEPTAW